jgi:hypothetical protein
MVAAVDLLVDQIDLLLVQKEESPYLIKRESPPIRQMDMVAQPILKRAGIQDRTEK